MQMSPRPGNLPIATREIAEEAPEALVTQTGTTTDATNAIRLDIGLPIVPILLPRARIHIMQKTPHHGNLPRLTMANLAAETAALRKQVLVTDVGNRAIGLPTARIRTCHDLQHPYLNTKPQRPSPGCRAARRQPPRFGQMRIR